MASLLLSLSILSVVWRRAEAFLSPRVRRGRPSGLLYVGDGNAEPWDLNILLIDHYDSFTYNLVDYFGRICQKTPAVIAVDASELPRLDDFDAIVLSPGPGHPADRQATKLSWKVMEECSDVPILGVCLGHQLLGLYHGAKVERAPEPLHGRVGSIEQSEDSLLWKNIERDCQVTRYHSLCVNNLPEHLLVTARAPDGVIMAMEHAYKPHYGVQFHPESIGTAVGLQLLDNFCRICNDKKNRAQRDSDRREAPSFVPSQTSASSNQHQIWIHKISNCNLQPMDVMHHLVKDESYCYWLDEAAADGSTPATSILGASARRIEYYGLETSEQIVLEYEHNELVNRWPGTDILSHLDTYQRAPQEIHMVTSLVDGDRIHNTTVSEDEAGLPFDFRGGHVGYLGYEVRHDTTRFLEEQENGHHHEMVSSTRNEDLSDSKVPTAAFYWADRSLVYDHQSKEWYLVGVSDEDSASTLEWMKKTAQELSRLLPVPSFSLPDSNSASVLPFVSNRPRCTYDDNFEECLEMIRQGESYELCLTNQLESILSVPDSSAFDLYRILRQRNPTPFSAFMKWDSGELVGQGSGNFAICCSSPERFVSIKRHVCTEISAAKLQVEAKPIKGTCARVMPANGRSYTNEESKKDMEQASALQASIKNRAENLMIVDLLRNDLSRVCEVGSVHVARLMDIESFTTVHQMVSTIRGKLDASKASPIDLLRSTFPGGSMTGAPKLRTMEILDKMEEGVSRGPYSGCLGYISLNGSMDMNIVIRTAVLTPQGENDTWKVSVGAGGAITALSENDDEYDEMLLKASAVINAVSEWHAGDWRRPFEAVSPAEAVTSHNVTMVKQF